MKFKSGDIVRDTIMDDVYIIGKICPKIVKVSRFIWGAYAGSGYWWSRGSPPKHLRHDYARDYFVKMSKTEFDDYINYHKVNFPQDGYNPWQI